ncbi:fimbrial protein [Pantoea endophytica]
MLKNQKISSVFAFCLIGITTDAVAGCTTSEPNITLPVPVGIIQRDTVGAQTLSTLESTIDLSCDATGFPTGTGARYWVVRVATSNIDHGVSNLVSNSRKTGYEGISLWWHMTGATYSRFPLNDPSHVWRLLTQPTGTTSTLNAMRLYKDGPLLAGVHPGYTIGLDLSVDNDATASFGRIVTFTIPSFTVNAVACSVTQPNIIVPMGDEIPTYRFKGIGSTSDEKSARIDLDCDAETRVNIKLEGRAVGSSAPGVIALNPEPGVATGVGIQMLKEGAPVNFNTQTVVGTVPTRGAYPIEYSARYYQTAASVQGGKANATVQFTLTYQ